MFRHLSSLFYTQLNGPNSTQTLLVLVFFTAVVGDGFSGVRLVDGAIIIACNCICYLLVICYCMVVIVRLLFLRPGGVCFGYPLEPDGCGKRYEFGESVGAFCV